MAAITFDYVGTELTQARAENPSPLQPIESGARVRIKKFSYTATGTVASGAIFELVEFANRVSIIGGALTEMDITDGAARLYIGWTPTATPADTNVSAFVSNTAAAAAFNPAIVTTTEKTTVYALAANEDLVAGDTFSGYILYVENS